MLAGRLHQCVHPRDLRLQHEQPGAGNLIGFTRLAAGRGVVRLRVIIGDALNQTLILQPDQSPIERAVAQPDLALAERFDVL